MPRLRWSFKANAIATREHFCVASHLTYLATHAILCVARIFKVEFRRHSHIAAAAYHDLVSLLLDDAVSEMRGTPTRRKRGKRAYWYDRYRVGKDTKERYLGEDTEELRARIERHELLRQEQEARAHARGRLVRLLRSERFLGLDAANGSLVSALAKSGAFHAGGILVGTVAFLLYEGELGLRLAADESAMTSDIDLASFGNGGTSEDGADANVQEVLAGFRYTPVPSLERNHTWRWKQPDGSTFVEFLTPSFRDDEGLKNLPNLGVSARALHHLEYLIGETIDAAAIYREGVLVKVPRPERFAVHKLIVADRRLDGPESLKARKDLMQAELLISILSEDRPMDLSAAYKDAMSRGPRWRDRLETSLERAPKIAGLISAAGEKR
jgi:hypothetical protein